METKKQAPVAEAPAPRAGVDYARLLESMSDEQRFGAAVAAIVKEGYCTEERAAKFLDGLRAETAPGRALAAGPQANEVMLYGPIGESSETLQFLAEMLGVVLKDNTARSVKSQLSTMTGKVTVRIHSYGGNYMESVGIGSALEAYAAIDGNSVETVNDAMAASAAAFIFLRGSVRRGDALSAVVFHEVRGTMGGIYSAPVAEFKKYAASVLEAAAEMEKMNAPLAAYVAGHTRLTTAEYSAKVAGGKDWSLSATEAVESGVYDEITGQGAEEAPDGGDSDKERMSAAVEAPGDHNRRERTASVEPEPAAEADSGGCAEEEPPADINRRPRGGFDFFAVAANAKRRH